MESTFHARYALRYLFFSIGALCLPFFGKSQSLAARHYPKGYFRYPVIARIGIAANYGELRPNHYHMGLDCRTNQVQNRPVVAAADGYVAHIRIEPFGFGRAIYINHPNGLTTLYGHLNKFFPALQRYVKAQQYKLKSWEVFLDIPKDMFAVKKGQLIAYSGNTGGSMGPHCHFEIRDTKTDKVLNPLLFGMPIPDNVAPTITRLAVYDRNVSTYSQRPALYRLQKTGGRYTTIPSTILVHSDKISFGISASDEVSGSHNPNGIYESILYVDQRPIMGFQIDSMTYQQSRYVNANIDYKTRAEGGPFIEHLSRLPGCPQGVYQDLTGDGVIDLEDHDLHQVQVVVKDPNGNTSRLEFNVKKANDVPETPGDGAQSNSHDPQEFKPGYVNIFENDRLQVILDQEAIYDSFAFRHAEIKTSNPDGYSDLFEVESALVPLQDSMTIRIKATRAVPQVLEGHMLIKRTWRGQIQVERASKNGDWYTAKFRDFGNFELIGDLQPPVIRGGFRENANLSRVYRIAFEPWDNNGTLRNFTATLDGKWLMFTHDKEKAYIYIFDEKCSRGKHTLRISVEDQAGNTTEKTFRFIR